jgi:hypothetical protein
MRFRSKLRAEGIIKTRGAPFEESDERELSSLAERGVYKDTRTMENEPY